MGKGRSGQRTLSTHVDTTTADLFERYCDEKQVSKYAMLRRMVERIVAVYSGELERRGE